MGKAVLMTVLAVIVPLFLTLLWPLTASVWNSAYAGTDWGNAVLFPTDAGNLTMLIFCASAWLIMFGMMAGFAWSDYADAKRRKR